MADVNPAVAAFQSGKPNPVAAAFQTGKPNPVAAAIAAFQAGKPNPVAAAIAAFQAGKPVIIMDDETRENEGDICLPAAAVTDADVLFFLHHTTGQLCVACSPLRIDQLELPPIVERSTDPNRTPFTVPVDLDRKHGTSTGVSAQDKAKTIRALADPAMTAVDFSRPGHINPLRASPQGLYGRQGHTEASVELCKLARVFPACLIAELMNADGTMSRLAECREFGARHSIPLITVKDLQRELAVGCARLPIRLSAGCEQPLDVQITCFSPPRGQERYVVLQKGEVRGKARVPLRIHSECLTGDVFRSARCDCSSQLRAALAMLEQNELGLLIYVRGQEGRGIGLENKIEAYRLQDAGHFDTYAANEALHLPADCRSYEGVPEILERLGVQSVVLYTDNPAKAEAIESYVAERRAMPGVTTPENELYVKTKAQMLAQNARTVGIAYTTSWHTKEVEHMRTECRKRLEERGARVLERPVSGSFELVMGAQQLFERGCDSVIALGVLLKGETYHFEAIVEAVGRGIMELQIALKKPVVYGVLTCYTQAQIDARVYGEKSACREWADTAIDMTTSE